jgi:hyaluronan synthase
MLIGILQLRQSIEHHTHVYLFTAFILLTWLLWLLKVALSRSYQPWIAPYTTTTSVVIPVVDEPIDLFRDVLERIIAQGPSQIVVVINGKRNTILEDICAEYDEALEYLWTPIAGKRNAVKLGVERSWGEVVLLVDSDTIWTPDTLSELIKPFKEPTVGGVTTRQRILDPERGFLTRWADWLENSRALYSMPAQSVLGTIGCLPGRTIAFRRKVLEDVMHDFMTQKFLGVFMEVSDDRTLTNLTLKQGFRTVYQSTSLVYTDAPTKFKKLVKQQFRWARGSQYNTLRMTPWMLGHAPLLAFFFLTDIALPFLWVAATLSWFIRMSHHDGVNLYEGMLHAHGQTETVIAIVLLTVFTSTLSMSLRQLRHLTEKPGDLMRMPFYILFSTMVLMPIRIYGFMRLGHVGGWGTRAGAHGTRETAPELASELALSGVGAGSDGASKQRSEPTAVRGVGDRRSGLNGTAADRRHQPPDGDPRGLIPYLIVTAIVTLGVLYDAYH